MEELHNSFKPMLTPKQMLHKGIFEVHILINLSITEFFRKIGSRILMNPITYQKIFSKN